MRLSGFLISDKNLTECTEEKENKARDFAVKNNKTEKSSNSNYHYQCKSYPSILMMIMDKYFHLKLMKLKTTNRKDGNFGKCHKTDF